jgi:hypothetical protein
MDSSLEEEILLYRAPFWVAHKQLQMMKTQSAKTHTLHHGFCHFKNSLYICFVKGYKKMNPGKHS